MKLSELRTITSKSDYLAAQAENPSMQPVHRAFPSAETNKIKLTGDMLDNVLKLVALLNGLNREQTQRLGFMMVPEPMADGKKLRKDESYYRDLHNCINKLIRNKIKNHNPKSFISYQYWHDYTNNRYIVLFVNPNSTDREINMLNEFVESLDDSDDTAAISRFFSVLLQLFVKLTLIHELNFDDTVIADGRVNINNHLNFLVDIGLSSDKKSTLYHALEPSLIVNNFAEIVTSMTYKRYASAVRNPDIAHVHDIDIFIPDTLPSRYKQFEDAMESADHQLVRDPANTGDRGVSLINLKAANKSILFYHHNYTDFVERILSEAGIAYEREVFDPDLRGRPQKKLGIEGCLDRPLVIINAVSKPVIEGMNTATIKFAPDKDISLESEEKKKSAHGKNNNLELEITYPNRDAVGAYIEYLRTDVFADYDVSVVNFADISYDELNSNTNYIFLQDPNPPHGYWHLCDAEKEAKLRGKFGDRWLEHINLNFYDDEIKIKREKDFLKILHQKRVYAKTRPDVTFYTDPYTTWKIRQFEEAQNGADKVALQGLHMPSLKTAARLLLPYTNYINGKPAPKGYVPTVTTKSIDTEFGAALSKIQIDLEIKHTLSAKEEVALFDNTGSKADLSSYAGMYRCYYILRPITANGKRFYASALDVEITSNGIAIKKTAILSNEAAIRCDEKFPIGDAAVNYLHNDGFYLVNEAGDVLTCYTDPNVVRPLSSMVPYGEFAGDKLPDYIFKARSNDGFGADIPLSRNKTGNLAYQTDMIAFYVMPSSTKPTDFVHKVEDADGKFIGVGGSYWLFFKALDSGIVSMFLTNKQDLQPAGQSKANRVYHLLVKNKNGEVLDASRSPLALMYIETTTFHVAKVKGFSLKSILHSISKIALTN